MSQLWLFILLPFHFSVGLLFSALKSMLTCPRALLSVFLFPTQPLKDFIESNGFKCHQVLVTPKRVSPPSRAAYLNTQSSLNTLEALPFLSSQLPYGSHFNSFSSSRSQLKYHLLTAALLGHPV